MPILFPFPGKKTWSDVTLSEMKPEQPTEKVKPLLDKLETAGVRLTAFELGNEINTSRFNSDLPDRAVDASCDCRISRIRKIKKGAGSRPAIWLYVRVLAAHSIAETSTRRSRHLIPKSNGASVWNFLVAGTYHGREAAKRYLMHSRAGWAEGSSEAERFITVGDRIVVFVYARFRPRDSNEWQQVKLADVYSVRKGRIVQMNAFADRQQALSWAGAKIPNDK